MILMIIISNTSILKILTIPILFHVLISICLVFQPLAHQCIFQYFSFISIFYHVCVTVTLLSISLVFHTMHIDDLCILSSENLGYFSHLFWVILWSLFYVYIFPCNAFGVFRLCVSLCNKTTYYTIYFAYFFSVISLC